jgi:hypothetical protein
MGGKGVGNDEYRRIVSSWSGSGADQPRYPVAGREGAKVRSYGLMAGRLGLVICMLLNSVQDFVSISKPISSFLNFQFWPIGDCRVSSGDIEIAVLRVASGRDQNASFRDDRK